MQSTSFLVLLAVLQLMVGVDTSFFMPVSETLGFQEGMTFYESPASLHADVNKTADDLVSVLLSFKQSAKRFVVILRSEEVAFMKSFLHKVLKDEEALLKWPTRLLLVTTRAVEGLLPSVKETMAVVNGLIIAMDGNILRSEKRWNIYSVIPFSQRTLKLGSWSKASGLTLTDQHNLFPSKYSRLPDGASLVVAGEEYPPHCKLKEIPATESTKEWLEFSGPMITTLEILARSMNFTYSLVRPPDRSWGYQLADGSWVGMVGMVKRQEVTMALGPFGINPLRKSVVDFTRIMLVDYVRITAKQGESEIDPWGFAMPLAPLVWAATFATLGAVISASMVESMVVLESEKHADARVFSYFRILLQQDVLVTSGRWFGRLLIAVWMLTTLILTKSYSGNLMSLLAVRYIPQPLQSLRKVLDASGVAMVWESNTEYTQYIMSVDSGIFHEVAQSEEVGRMVYTTGSEYDTTLDHLVMEGDHVLIIEDLSIRMLLAEHFTRTGQCEFYMSSERFLPSAMAMITQKNSPLGPAMDERIKALTESGLYTHWIQNAVPNSTSCSNPPKRITVESTLKITNLWGMFVILSAGFLISGFALCCENVFYKIV